MKTKLTPLFAILLAALLLSVAACGDPENHSTDSSADSNAETNVAGNPADTLTSSEGVTEAATALPVYPGDIDLELPEMKETPKAILSVKNGKILGMETLDKPKDTEIIRNYTDFQANYGVVEGIDEAFFDSYVLRLAHSAQSSGSTHYAVESVTPSDGKIEVEIIEQHAAMSTRDLRYHYVLVAVEKAHAETPFDVHITGVQLAS